MSAASVGLENISPLFAIGAHFIGKLTSEPAGD
jgi:hypothetical protein